ncbi:unnamed protein product [Chrysoparadoxa australica]
MFWRVIGLLLCLALCAQAFLASPIEHGAGSRRGGQHVGHAAQVQFGGLQHAGVLVSNTAKSKDFFINVLGFTDETELRPNLPFPGAFLRAGGQQIHLMELPNPADPLDGRPEHGGRDRHLAFSVASIEPMKARLEAAGVTYTMSKSGRAALFCRDPDGNAFEFLEMALP